MLPLTLGSIYCLVLTVTMRCTNQSYISCIWRCLYDSWSAASGIL